MCDENITAAPATVERVKKIDNIHIEYNFPVIVIKKMNNCIGLFNEKPGSTLSSWYGPRVDGVFVAIGMKPNTGPLKELLPSATNDYIDCWDDSLLSMYVSRLYVAGDVRTKKVRQGITAAADGAIAVQSVIDYLKK